jgi:AraC-like DNA-binding protein
VTDENSCLFRVHRTGVGHQLPTLFRVERSATTKYCEIFCILSGKGYLEYGGKHYELQPNQIVLLPAHEPHKYWNDADTPMGKVWLEFYGANANEIIRNLLRTHGPIVEGLLFSDICAQVCLIQQRLMINPKYLASVEIYQILHTLMQSSDSNISFEISEDRTINFLLVEAYINAHISRKIPNAELAQVCGLSLQHFMKQFRAHHRLPPQEYIMQKRIRKAGHILLNTDYSVDDISDSLGFCNTSHFIRRFSEATSYTPAQYRKKYKT